VTPGWGTRGRLCLVCQTALTDEPGGGPCCDWSTVIPLADPAYRARCEREIHGPPTAWHDAVTMVRRWWRWRWFPKPALPDRFVPVRPGVIRAGEVAPPPWGGRGCSAYGIELHDRVRLVLVDAWSLGFELELDDGRRARVPPGRIQLDLRGAPAGDAELTAYLRDVVQAPGARPFRYRELRVRTLAPGDRIALCGSVTDGEGLRDAPVLIPKGPALLK